MAGRGTDQHEAERMGRHLAQIVLAAVPRLEPVAPRAPAHCSQSWSVTRTRTLDQTAQEQFHRLLRAGETFETEIMALAAGDLAIVGIPGEALSEIASAVCAGSPFRRTRVLSCANDVVGYIPTDETQRQGAHEAAYAPAENMERHLMEKIRTALEALVS